MQSWVVKTAENSNVYIVLRKFCCKKIGIRLQYTVRNGIMIHNTVTAVREYLEKEKTYEKR